MEQELLFLLTDAREKNWIKDSELKFLYVKNPCVVCFYMLPKIQILITLHLAFVWYLTHSEEGWGPKCISVQSSNKS